MKEKFIDIFRQNIKRPGSEKLLAYLETTDFFTAPASTRFHLSRPGGLVEHSIHVYERLFKLAQDEFENWEDLTESIAIIGLLHDVCKANFYSVEMRNRKNESGQWEKYPFYVVDDQLPYGHGEKSVYVISGFMRLSRDEAMAVRWHMGGFDDAVKGGSFSVGNAYGKYPLALLAHLADMQATYLNETEASE